MSRNSGTAPGGHRVPCELRSSPPRAERSFLVNSTQGTVEVPEERTVRIRPAGRVYYNRAGVQVTERWFATEDAVYPVAQLNRLRTGRGPLHPIVQTTSAVALVFASAFLVSLPTLRDTPAAWLTLAAVAAVPLVAAALAVRY